MNIAIDGRPVEKPVSRYRSVGLYTKRLCDALLKRNRSLERPHTFTIIASNDLHVWNGKASVRHIPEIRKPSRLQWVLDRWALPRVLKQSGTEVFHATEFTSIPVSTRTKVIAHVHDMIPFIFWKEYSRRIPIDYRYALALARDRVATAPYVVTDSQHSKKDIVELTGYPEERIYVAYGGAPNEPGEEVSDKTLRRTDRPYFLYVGGTDFRKNVPFLIRAFARFAERERDTRLMLIGETFTKKSLPEVAEILREVNRLHIMDRVVMNGYVDDQTLRDLYRGGVALVFPSLYEGFGLPVLEAMTYGTPVLAAQTSSIPEVLGDTGIYFDPRDEDSLIAGLETVYRDPTHCGAMVEKAKQRSSARRVLCGGAAVVSIPVRLLPPYSCCEVRF